MARRSKHAGKSGGAITAVQARGVIMIDVEIRAVRDDNLAPNRLTFRVHRELIEIPVKSVPRRAL